MKDDQHAIDEGEDGKTFSIFPIIPTFSRPEGALAVAAQLARQGVPAAAIHIVDHGSEPSVEGATARALGVTVVRGDPAAWWSGAMNAGLRAAMPKAADGDRILAINDDARILPGYVDALCRAAVSPRTRCRRSPPSTATSSRGAACNAPSQIVISGDAALVAEAVRELARLPNAKLTRLRVAGAWHSPHMRPAVEAFAGALGRLELSRAASADEAPIAQTWKRGPKPRARLGEAVPMIFNRDGHTATEPAAIRELLAGQLESPIRFDAVLRRLAELKVTDYVEIGPGNVLRGLVRLNLPDPGIRVHGVTDLRSAERTAVALLSR